MAIISTRTGFFPCEDLEPEPEPEPGSRRVKTIGN